MNAILKSTELELHPLCTLFPRLAGSEFDALRDDIRVNGLRHPIVLHQGMILDGGNRYRACVDAGIEPKFAKFEGSNLVSFVLSANLHRRHMTAGQQAAIVASAQDWAKAQPQGGTGANQHAQKEQRCNVAPLRDTAASRAAESGASLRTQKMADKVAKSAPDLSRRVAHGEISLPKAHAEVSGKLPKIRPRPEQKPVPANDDGPDLAELVDDLQAENTRLTALLQAAQANDLAAEAVKWRAAYDRALAAQSEAMDAASRSEKREKFTKKQLMRCGKAVGVDDPTKIAVAVEALARKVKP